jgi:transaldolase
MPDPLADLSMHGVAVWLDDLSRELLAGGRLESLIRDRSVVGVTTNPTIFASALANGDAYTAQISQLAAQGTGASDAVFAITTHDVRAACDVLAPVFQSTGGMEGRVSIEVNPRLARDTEATVSAAHALAEAVGRPNLYIKIPATVPGLTAVTAVIASGVSVNVTLIFSLRRYWQVMEAYLDGLAQARAAGRDLTSIHSVASFFVSRVDTEIDARLEKIGTREAGQAKGKAGIANARLAYQAWQDALATGWWKRLRESGANPQWPLWASTGVKDPAYPDTMYVSELVAPGTVNTMSLATLEAFDDHGQVRGDTITGTYQTAREHLDRLARLGIDYDEVTARREEQGLAKFEAIWEELSATVAAELHRHGPAAVSRSEPEQRS